MGFSQALNECTGNAVNCASKPFGIFAFQGERVFWLYLVSSFVIGAIVFFFARPEQGGSAEGREKASFKSFVKYAFPWSVYSHKSAIADYLFVWANRIIYPVAYAAYLTLANPISDTIQTGCKYLLGGFAFPEAQGIGLTIAFSLYIVVALDLSLFVAHYIQHKNRYLWEFHKVHHSAEVMTPLTVYRMHPIDDMITATASVFITGIASGIFTTIFPKGAATFSVAELNVFYFVFYLLGYNLRHTHIWLSYGAFWSKIFISPAQHQIHHSEDTKHYDKNFGFIFAFWDYFTGSLYIPKEKENLVFGIGPEKREYHGLFRLYFRPFQQFFKLLVSKPPKR